MGSIGTGHPGHESPQRILRSTSPLRGEDRIIAHNPAGGSAKGAGVSFVDLGDSVRLAVMLVPQRGGSFLEQTLEIVATLALFGYLNRWNDTMATALEQRAVEVAERAIGPVGWQAGKHEA